jgi:NAD(P)H-hydrate repair Nnr-like enzyme with NAD(P)H-hydrate dehydratase domain
VNPDPGMIGAFLARGLDPLLALQTAVYLHGVAGDLAAGALGEEGLIPGDILEHIPAALRGLD